MANLNLYRMGQGWARYQRRINHEQLRYEQLKGIATHYNIQARVTNVQSTFRAIEQVLSELFILQKKYMLHLNPSELNLPFIRFLLKWCFKIGGKSKLNALLRELKGYNDTIERTLELCHHPPPQRQDGLGAPRMGHHVHDAIAASNWRKDVSPLILVSQPLSATLSHHPTTKTHFLNYSSRSSPQASPTVGRPASILSARADSPTPSNSTNIRSWFMSTETFFSQERDDNCSGPLDREYASSSSQG